MEVVLIEVNERRRRAEGGGILSLSDLLALSVTPQLGTKTMVAPTPSTLFIGDSARERLERLQSKVLIIPYGAQNLHLQSVQIPESENNSVPFLFTYTDGSRTISLVQLHNAALSFQPKGTAIATMSGTVTILGDKEAPYRGTTSPMGKTIELTWREDDLMVAIRSEQASLNDLTTIANALIYSK